MEVTPGLMRVLKNIFTHQRVWYMWAGSSASTPYILSYRQMKNPAAYYGVLPRKKP
jgi:hypothetical protein